MSFEFTPMYGEIEEQNPHQVKSLLASSATKRLRYFYTEAASEGELWGLCLDNHWASTQTSDGILAILLWPKAEYAQIYRNHSERTDLKNHRPGFIKRDYFLKFALPKLEQNNLFAAVFFTPTDPGIILPPTDIKTAIEQLQMDWDGRVPSWSEGWMANAKEP